MPMNEMMALIIVALAALCAIRLLKGPKGGGCCGGSDCLPKFKKEELHDKEKKKE